LFNGSDGQIDKLVGGAGDDTYRVLEAIDMISEALGGGTDTVDLRVGFAGSYTLAANVERLLADDVTAGVTLVGNALDNYITGGAGLDRLDGGAGVDTMAGGGGDDTYVVDNAADRVVCGPGFDTVLSSVSFNLGSNGAEVESLTLTGSAGSNGIGNALGNSIQGNAGDNFLQGLGGDDVLWGGAGSDVLEGGDGVDRLYGDPGADRMAGGAGSDFYYVDDAGDVVSELAGEGEDYVISYVTYTVGPEVEQLILSPASGAINGFIAPSVVTEVTLWGNNAANILQGGSGDDLLWGQGGHDTMTGGAGADTFLFSSAIAADSDTVLDFVDDYDKIGLPSGQFNALGPTVEAGEVNGYFTGAWLAGTHLAYDPEAGELYYSAAGDGFDKVLIGELQPTGALNVSEADFLIF
jgi:Ca2+-binding RTX toxin-like protein